MNTRLFFSYLALRNFLSFGNNLTEVDLSDPGTISVEGVNYDQGGSNGAGKTTFINAICYALYNKPFDSISLQRLINSTNATKNTLMEVILTFEKNGHSYTIHRTRGESHSIKITQDGEDITPGKGVTECDAFIEDIIGISYELFTKTIIFSGNAQAFLQLPVAHQRQQIEELFNITLLSEKAVKLRKLIQQTESDIKVQEAIVRQQEVAVELHEKHVRESEDRIARWSTERLRDIKSIESTLAVIGTVDFELEQTLHDEKARLTQEIAYLAAKMAPVQKDKQQLERALRELISEETHLKDARCPYCAQNFADAATKLKRVLANIDTSSEALATVEETLTKLNLESTELRGRLKEVQDAIQHANLTELLTARENASALQVKLEGLRGAINPHIEPLERLKQEGTSAVEYGKIDALKKRLEHQAFLLKLFTSKDSFLRRKILNRSIPFLNERINFYTGELGLPHIVRFDADLSCTVSEFGRELDFGNLSAGEKKRVNTGMALAFRDVLHHLHAKCNLLLIDELDGQLDGAGLDAIVRILKDKARDEDLAIYVISHHPNITGRLDRTMTITKQHGFSQLE